MRAQTLAPGEVLDYDRVGLLGFSVGAQMVSRALNDFPRMALADGATPFPAVRAAVMLGGGSLACYSTANVTRLAPCARSPRRSPPEEWCCPNDVSEPNYDNGRLPWARHPPVLLLQTARDSYADPAAHAKYAALVAARGVGVASVVSPGERHGLCPCQTDPLVNFITDVL